MDLIEATADYERWLAAFFSLDLDDLAYKHRQMANPRDPFPFFRATYYRWVTLWQEQFPPEAATPRVLAVGDLHLENYGTWRDTDGRLCWGVNDFDEAAELPYSSDLVRLAVSVRLAAKAGHLRVRFKQACKAILAGYRETLAAGGVPFVLEEHHPELRRMAMAAERDPVRFWARLVDLLNNPSVELPPKVLDAMVRTLPAAALETEVRHRPRVGMGSLGKPRFVMLAQWEGGWVAREAKALCPPATAWPETATPKPGRIKEIVSRAVRCPDPFFLPGKQWLIRRLAPRCSRIELPALRSTDDVLIVLRAMGAEAANIHIGTPNAAEAIERDLETRPRGWLRDAGRLMSKLILCEWRTWKEHFRQTGHQRKSSRAS